MSGKVVGVPTAADRKEWAAAAGWLADAWAVKDIATIMALSTTQRSTLCRMLGVVGSADGQTAAARIVRAWGPIGPRGASWRSFVEPLTLAEFDEIDKGTAVTLMAGMDASPFKAATVGLTLEPLRELAFAASWSFRCLKSRDIWEATPVELRDFLRATFKVPVDWEENWAADVLVGMARDWRLSEGEAASSDSDSSSVVDTTELEARRVAAERAAVDAAAAQASRDIVLPVAAVDGRLSLGVEPWWIKSDDMPGAWTDTVAYAQHNILTPYGLGPANIQGSSAWHGLSEGGAFALSAAVSVGTGNGNSALEGYAHEERRTTLRAVLLKYITLFSNSDSLLTQEYALLIKDARKQEDLKRRKATSPLASYPWLQRFTADTGQPAHDPFVWGQRIAVAMRCSNENFSSLLEGIARVQSGDKRAALLARFDTEFAGANMASLLLVITDIKAHVKAEMRTAYTEARRLAGIYPASIELREMCAGRHQQTLQLSDMWEQITEQFAARGTADEHLEVFEMGSWGCLIDGFRSSTSAAKAVRTAIMARGAGFAKGDGGSGVGASLSGMGGGGGASTSSWGSAQGGAVSLGGRGEPGVGARGATQTAGGGSSAAAGGGVGGGKMKFQIHAPLSKQIIGDKIGVEPPGSKCHSAGVATGQAISRASVRWNGARHSNPCPVGTSRASANWLNGTERSRRRQRLWHG